MTLRNPALFSNVFIKFFTIDSEYENKGATKSQTSSGDAAMIRQTSQILARSADTLMYDLGGVLALAVLTVAMLHLPGLV